MQQNEKFSVAARIASFRYAFRGLATLVRTQHNTWVHAVATLLVLSAGVYYPITRADWLWLIVSIGMVWIAEALNTAVEFLGDAVSLDHHPLIGHAKDIASAGVLIAAITAAVIGILIFWPHL